MYVGLGGAVLEEVYFDSRRLVKVSLAGFKVELLKKLNFIVKNLNCAEAGAWIKLQLLMMICGNICLEFFVTFPWTKSEVSLH